MLQLKDVRSATKHTQAEVATYLGISQQAYANYENRRREPDLKTVDRLADYFGVTVDYLLGRTNNPTAHSFYLGSPSLTAAEPGNMRDGYLTGDPSLGGFLSPEDAEHMRKYQTIPNDGKKRVDNVLDFEYKTFTESEDK